MSVDINHRFVFQNNPFDERKKYSTTIRISPDGLSVFVTLDLCIEYAASYQWAKSNDLTHFSLALKTVKEQDAFLKNNLQNIRLLCDDQGYTLVPQSLFVESELKNYLTPLVDPEKLLNGIVISSEINQIVVVSLLNQELTEISKSIFPNSELYSFTHALLSFSQIKDLNEPNYLGMVSMNSNYFDLVIKKRGQLHFFNRFEFSTKEDFVYFLMATLQNLEIKNSDIELALLGEIYPQSPITEILNRYFPKVGFVKTNQELAWDYHRYCVEQNY